jgi:hypothetical protein
MSGLGRATAAAEVADDDQREQDGRAANDGLTGWRGRLGLDGGLDLVGQALRRQPVGELINRYRKLVTGSFDLGPDLLRIPLHGHHVASPISFA